jgi:hypothetical protein
MQTLPAHRRSAASPLAITALGGCDDVLRIVLVLLLVSISPAIASAPEVFERELREDPAQVLESQYVLLFNTPDAETVLADKNYEGLTYHVLSDALCAVAAQGIGGDGRERSGDLRVMSPPLYRLSYVTA